MERSEIPDPRAPPAAVIVSRGASRRLHGVNPETCLRDALLRIDPWPADQALPLAPRHGAGTREGLGDAGRSPVVRV